MGLISQLSWRNLLRQKRRNLFLGAGIAFGMMILVIANSFSHGMVDVVVNDLVAYGYGHLVLGGTSGNQAFWIFRDGAAIKRIVDETIPKKDRIRVIENLSVSVRVIGHGESDNLWISGYTPQNQKTKADFFYNKNLSITQGNFQDYYRKDIEYPIILFEAEAKALNVKLYDKLLVTFPMVTGQIQTAQLTVVALAKSTISMMNLTSFMEISRAKQLFGYKPWESASLQITLKNPKQNAKQYANLLRKKLQPHVLSLSGKAGAQAARILAFNNDDQAKNLVGRNIQIVAGDRQTALGKEGVMLSRQLAEQLKVVPGGEFVFEYPAKFRGLHRETLAVSAIYESSRLDANTILMNGERVWDIYNRFLPRKTENQSVDQASPLYPALATGWKLYPASPNNEALQNKYQVDRMFRSKQTKFDVVTMYEGAASQVLQIEGVLELLTFFAVLTLFFIILIGVINTLRMTVRERTREIGTLRAIGMHKRDVRNMFVLENLYLTLIAATVGIILGILAIKVLGMISFNIDNDLSIILKNKHLPFKLNLIAITQNLVLIMIISGLTAFFPARRAAKLPAVEALRGFE